VYLGVYLPFSGVSRKEKVERMKFEKVRIDSNDEIVCPVCGEGYLHQTEIEAGWRHEDKDGLRHTSGLDGAEVSRLEGKDISSPYGYGYRRDYLVIRFDCECCGSQGIELCIWQHKGRTGISWVSLGEHHAD